MIPRARLRNGRLIIDCPAHLDPVFKAMPGSKWFDVDEDEGYWRLRPYKDVVRWMKAVGFAFSYQLKQWYKENCTCDLIDVQMKLPLREYQTLGVSFIESRDGRAIVGDDMGLGKTPQSIAWAVHNDEWPVVVVI